MKSFRKKVWLILLAGIFAVNTCIPAFAASHTISSVSIKIKADDVEVGEHLPDLSYGSSAGDNDGGVYVYTTSGKYIIREVEWVTSESKDMKVGDEPKMKVWLTSDDDDYYFRGTYRSSNVSVSGGSFVDAKKDDGDLVVTVKLNPIKGTYDEPDDAYWKENSLGKARWSRGDSSSGAYDVYLYRGSSLIKKVEEIEATSYNFYPYMTQKGTYSFKVRTVPKSSDEKKYGKKSDWVESDEQYIASEDVSDGSGQTDNNGTGSGGNNGQVGWIQDGDNWYFKYPDGNYHKNGWLKWSDKWYLFDANGYMQTGWKQINNIWYYLSTDGNGPKGAMKTGWIQLNNAWYYLNPSPDGPEGAMVTGWLTVNGKRYYMGPGGAMIEGWYKIGDGYYYFYPGDGSMAANTTINGFQLDANGVWIMR
ncbi:N-acetylmuramoyl-L-alanine amidase family protein [Clostridium sp. AM58-1XD]|uniref:N-acetylmuramoyl-L-alanine amidase family protein n=1 Tax=Clostridium sp. AM58-1XD TaxID=2292307 RepID=UPI000E53C706|nr:N-acetylmuramoyl-L-alanine amidase family protein [Clostridium sp. AM58-1XD]RGY99868.1 N-acetylmuramoyl-L-alanine amidase family protein [Clostridium sp. AM58-1XD]